MNGEEIEVTKEVALNFLKGVYSNHEALLEASMRTSPIETTFSYFFKEGE